MVALKDNGTVLTILHTIHQIQPSSPNSAAALSPYHNNDWRDMGFYLLNPCKAAGPDSVSPLILKHCADQLSTVFTDIFNTLLETCHIPACFETFTIIPVPKITRTIGVYNHRPVALTSAVIKLFEHMLNQLKSITDPLLDHLQFTLRANRSFVHF